MNIETPYEQLFFTTALMKTEHADKPRTGSGTGFFYGVNVGPDQAMLFLVTNKHVIEGATKVYVTLVAGSGPEMKSPLLGQSHTLELPSEIFFGHPDPDIDVAAAPISPWMNSLQKQGKWACLRALAPAIALTDSTVSTLDALEEVTFIGYPNGIYDRLNFLPIARRGVTATPVGVDYEGKPVFLVDASVFPGSSGSPVFIAQTGGYAGRGGGFILGGRVILLGIIAAVYQRSVPILQLPTDGMSVVMDPINIGIVYKAKTIEEVVDSVLARFKLSRYVAQPESALVTPAVSKDAAIGKSPN
jgi:Trypsin-like peptidase domain